MSGKSTPPKAAENSKVPAVAPATCGKRQISQLGRNKSPPEQVRKIDTVAAVEAAKLESFPWSVSTDLATEVMTKRHTKITKQLNWARFLVSSSERILPCEIF